MNFEVKERNIMKVTCKADHLHRQHERRPKEDEERERKKQDTRRRRRINGGETW